MKHEPRLVYWAGNSMPYPLLDRARGAAEAGYKEISTFMGDLFELEARGGSLADLRRELDGIGVTLNATDPLLDWYPSYNPASPIGVAVKYGGPHLAATMDDVIRWTSELGAEFVSLVAPFHDPAGQHETPPDSSIEEIVDSLGHFADRAATVGLRPHLEVIPTTKISDLSTALDLIQRVGRPNLGLLVDTYNLGRAGVRPVDLDDVSHEVIFQRSSSPTGFGPRSETTTSTTPSRRGPGPVREISKRERWCGASPPRGHCRPRDPRSSTIDCTHFRRPKRLVSPWSRRGPF